MVDAIGKNHSLSENMQIALADKVLTSEECKAMVDAVIAGGCHPGELAGAGSLFAHATGMLDPDIERAAFAAIEASHAAFDVRESNDTHSLLQNPINFVFGLSNSALDRQAQADRKSADATDKLWSLRTQQSINRMQVGYLLQDLANAFENAAHK